MHHVSLELGQVYREVDPRFDRRVKVIGFDVAGVRKVQDDNVRTKPGKVTLVAAPVSAPAGGRISFADVKRFSGKSGGYELITE